MKTLKFTTKLIPLVLSGEKTSIFRLFDDKDLQVGDTLSMVHKEGGDEFAQSIITHVYEKKLKDLEVEDYKGHEKFESDEQMYAEYRKYYGDKVSQNTIVKIIHFKLIKDNLKFTKLDRWNLKKKNLHISVKKINLRIRGIYWVSLGENIGFEQNGKNKNFERPVLVLRVFNKHMFLGLPMTSMPKNESSNYYFVTIYKSKKYYYILPQVRLYSTKRVLRFLRKINQNEFEEIKQQLKDVMHL